jgi:hypothetical protein
MRKYIICAVSLLIAITVSTACGNAKPLNESEIEKIIPNNITEGMNIVDLAIDKRQTNGKEDTVYVIIDMENSEVHKTAYYTLAINYYDQGGWILDKSNKYQDPTYYPLTPPSESLAFNVLNTSLSYNDYTVSLVSSDTDNFATGRTSFVFDVRKENGFLVNAGDIRVGCDFSESGGQWKASIKNENIVQKWNFEAILGIWTASWDDPPASAGYDMTFTINILEATDAQIRANGRATRGAVRGLGDFDIQFDDNFPCTATYMGAIEELSFRVASVNFGWGVYDNYNLDVVIRPESIILYYNNIRGSFGDKLSYPPVPIHHEVVLEKTGN